MKQYVLKCLIKATSLKIFKELLRLGALHLLITHYLTHFFF